MEINNNTSKNNFARILVGLFFLSVSVCHSQGFTNFVALDNQLRSAITNINTPDSLLLESIAHLGAVTEPPSFWTQIADNTNYTLVHRTRAVFALFRRHGQYIHNVWDLRRCLTPANWLKQSPVEKVVQGFMPVDLRSGDTVFSISVLYGPKIYIRLIGHVEYNAFLRVLLGEGHVDPNSEMLIGEYGYADDYYEWLRADLYIVKTNASAIIPDETNEEK